MCRAGVRYFSTSTRSSLKLASASRWQLASAAHEILGAVDAPHALAAAAGDGLDEHRETDALAPAASR